MIKDIETKFILIKFPKKLKKKSVQDHIVRISPQIILVLYHNQ